MANLIPAGRRVGNNGAMKVLIILNDAPYGGERAYNGLRTAMTLQKEHGADVRVFLFADAIWAAASGQKTPDGYYNVERMLKAILAKGGQIKLCGSCADARGFDRENAVPGVLIGSMPELADWVVEAEKSLVF